MNMGDKGRKENTLKEASTYLLKELEVLSHQVEIEEHQLQEEIYHQKQVLQVQEAHLLKAKVLLIELNKKSLYRYTVEEKTKIAELRMFIQKLEKELPQLRTEIRNLNKSSKLKAQNFVDLREALNKVVKESNHSIQLKSHAQALQSVLRSLKNKPIALQALKYCEKALEEYLQLDRETDHTLENMKLFASARTIAPTFHEATTQATEPKLNQSIKKEEAPKMERMKLFASNRKQASSVEKRVLRKTEAQLRQQELQSLAQQKLVSQRKLNENTREVSIGRDQLKKTGKLPVQILKDTLSKDKNKEELASLKNQRLVSEKSAIFKPLLKNALENKLKNIPQHNVKVLGDGNVDSLKAHQEDWLPFLKKSVTKNLKKEENLLLSIKAKVIPATFESVCKKLEKKITSYPNDIKDFQFKKLELTRKVQSHRAVYYLHEENRTQPIVEIAHIPEESKIDIALTDKGAGDEGLFLMVVSVKKMLEEMGKNEFNIEHCEENPVAAIKLYLIGKSLGLAPVFKDKKHEEGRTLENIKNAKIKLKQGSQQKTLFELYQELEALDTNQPEQLLQLKRSIKALKMEYTFNQSLKEHERHRSL